MKDIYLVVFIVIMALIAIPPSWDPAIRIKEWQEKHWGTDRKKK